MGLKQVKARSKRVLKASHVFLFEKSQLSASLNNLNIVVDICMTLCVDTLCIVLCSFLRYRMYRTPFESSDLRLSK